MENSATGTLVVKTFTADDALPIEDSLVRISGAGEYNGDVRYTLLTDMDGVTEAVTLPTPLKSASQTPTPVGNAYAIYDVVVSKKGYYTKTVRGVAVFADIESVLTVAMIPFVSNNDGGSVPRGNLYTDIPDISL